MTGGRGGGEGTKKARRRSAARGWIAEEGLFLVFEPAVEPAEEEALPHYGVLGLEYPVVLVGIDYHLGGNATELGGVEGGHALGGEDAVVVLAVGNHDGSGPAVDEAVGGVGEGALSCGVVLLPEGSAHVPVGKPHFFGFEILGLHVEDAGVGEKGCEAAFVVAGEPVDGEAAVACAGGAYAGVVDVGLGLEVVDSGEVVLHVLAGIILGNLRVPLCAEAGKAATVGGDDYVAVGAHKGEVPAIAPELADGLLRAALAVEDGGILLSGVELGRINHPHEHLLAVGGGHHALLHGGHVELGEDVAVDVGEGSNDGSFLALEGDELKLVGAQHAVVHGNEAVVAYGGEGGEIGALVGELADGLCLHINGEHGNHALVGSDEIDALAVGRPCELVDGVVPVGGDIALLGCVAVEDEEAVAVALVAVVLHREPCQALAVGREGGHGVVAEHAFGEVVGLACGEVIEVEVGVGGDGVLSAGLLAGDVDEHLAVGAPGEGLHTAEGLHGSFEGFVGHDVAEVGDGLAVEVADERMGNFGDPFVPVLVHEVVDDAAGGLGKVGIDVGGGAGILDIAYHHHFLAVGRDEESADAALVLGSLHSLGAVGVHEPHLHLAFRVGIEECYAAVGHPHGAALALGGGGDAHGLCVLGVETEGVEVVVGGVLLKALVGDAEEHGLAVGADTRSAYTSERLESIDVEHAGVALEVHAVDHRGIGRSCGACRGDKG